MSLCQEAPPSHKIFVAAPPSRFNLTAHTASAIALTEGLFNGSISQDDYDAHILPTSIKSDSRYASIPIIMTTMDSPETILAVAIRGLGIPSANRESANLYLWCPRWVLSILGIPAPVSGELVRLDHIALTKVVTYMKERGGATKLELACEDGITNAEDLIKLVARRRELEDEFKAMMGPPPAPSSISGHPQGRRLWSDAPTLKTAAPVQQVHRNAIPHRTRKIPQGEGTTWNGAGAKEREGRKSEPRF